ncbi:flagellar protein FlaG [Mariprofundus ferrooxydans]|uniref:Flagellar protein FlaG n=2 Tax=Mariprofundus ferrooxydans TaxID=314344 RepID=Q0F277_9PROT|nr:flagellar protein FlaG [Mariprofundus ferrooxydans PV-1]KON48599.1 flagellar protein FlaG [Mariprofundus ferrooxydans]
MGAAVVRSGNQQQATPPVSAEQAQAKPEQKASLKDVQQAVQQANASLPGSNEAISFGYEEKLGQLYVQVTDKHSGAVIREIPSKEFIQHSVFMREMIGLLLDRKA